MRFLSIALVILCVGGCASQPTAVSVTQSFDPKASAFVLQPGDGTVRGEAFLLKDDGAPHIASGAEVRLVPATPYSRARIAALYKDGKTAPPATVGETPPDYARHQLVTKADRMGRFTFEHVAAGRYFVTTSTFWRESDAFTMVRAMMYDEVEVKSGETTKVVLNGR